MVLHVLNVSVPKSITKTIIIGTVRIYAYTQRNDLVNRFMQRLTNDLIDYV